MASGEDFRTQWRRALAARAKAGRKRPKPKPGGSRHAAATGGATGRGDDA